MMQAAARGVVLSSRTTSSSASSSSHTKRVFIEISNAVLRSNIRWRGRSFATSVASDSIKPQKGQKKMSKQERRAMLESFVDKYRASNAGRFPTVSHARQQVGGSYYTVRQIIQELEYNSKVGPVKKIAEVQLKKVEKVIHPSSHATGKSSLPIIEEISSSVTTASCSPQTQSSESEVRSSMGVIDRIKMDVSPLVKDDETIEHFEAKDEPPISADLVMASNEEPIGRVTEVMNPLRKQIVEGIGNLSSNSQTVCDAQIDIEVHRENAPSRLVNESLQSNDQDSAGTWESNVSTSRAAIAAEVNASLKTSDNNDLAVDSSISVKSGTTVDISHSPPGEIERSRKDKSSAEFLQDTHDPKGVKQIGDREDTKSEDFNGDHPKRFEHGESSTKGSNIWGNLKSFADGIINFWKKM